MFLLSTYLIACGDQVYLPYFGIFFIDFCFGVGVVLFAIKKLMSIIQLISASELLADMDISERKEK